MPNWWGSWVFGMQWGLLYRGANKSFPVTLWASQTANINRRLSVILISLAPFLWHYIVPQESLQIFFLWYAGKYIACGRQRHVEYMCLASFYACCPYPSLWDSLGFHIVMCILKKQTEGKKRPELCTKSKQFTACLSSWGEDKKTNIIWYTLTMLFNALTTITWKLPMIEL